MLARRSRKAGISFGDQLAASVILAYSYRG